MYIKPMSGESKTYHFENAYVDGAWDHNVEIGVDTDGIITSISFDTEPLDNSVVFSGFAIPAMANAHSHAFQRAFAGLAEGKSYGDNDNFWSWRNEMYKFLGHLTPDDVAAISAQLYVEMLKAGYTSVAEFHYLHNDIDGKPYADKAIMSKALIDGAGQAGIGMSLVPILYQQAGIDGAPLEPQQQRFFQSVDDYLSLYESINADKAIGFHSIRAVSSEAMQEVLANVSGAKINGTSVHIHIAEQEAELIDCLLHCNATPVDYLFDIAEVDERWCLVHATHINAAEMAKIAKAKAVVALCPTTEANLGDGIFPIFEFLKENGRFAIGSDSHISINPASELRQIEYIERLTTRSRNVLDGGLGLWQMAQSGGSQVMGQMRGLSVGAKADILILDKNHPSMVGRSGDQVFDTFIFAQHGNLISQVISGGKWVVKDFKHIDEENILTNYNKIIKPYLERH